MGVVEKKLAMIYLSFNSFYIFESGHPGFGKMIKRKAVHFELRPFFNIIDSFN